MNCNIKITALFLAFVALLHVTSGFTPSSFVLKSTAIRTIEEHHKQQTQEKLPVTVVLTTQKKKKYQSLSLSLPNTNTQLALAGRNDDPENANVNVNEIANIDAVTLTAVGFALIAFNFLVFANMGDVGIGGLVARIINTFQ